MKPTSDFDPVALVKRLLREGRSVSIATVWPDSGAPYNSMVNMATAADGSPLFLNADISWHTKNFRHDPRICLLITDSHGKASNPLANARVSVMGTIARVDDKDVEDVSRRYLAHQPKDQAFLNIHDFHFYKMTIEHALYNGGFAKAGKLMAEEILTRVDDAAKLVAAESGVMEHMNNDHAEACRLYATKLLGGQDGAWRCVGCDPEGLDLQLDRTALRLTFPKRVRTPGAMRKTLIRLSEKARAV